MKEEGDFRGETFAGFMLLNDEGAGNIEPGGQDLTATQYRNNSDFSAGTLLNILLNL